MNTSITVLLASLLCRIQSPCGHPLAAQNTIIGTATMAATSPTVFHSPAVGLPKRIESTELRGTETRQESHCASSSQETPDTESGVTTTPCQRVILPPCQTCTCWLGLSCPGFALSG